MDKKMPNYRFPMIKAMISGLVLLGLMGCASSNGNSGNYNNTNGNSSGNTRMDEFKAVWRYSDGVPRRMEADYGRSVVNNRLEMMVTPPDAVDTKPALGLPPQAAKNAQERYDKSFKEKEEPQKVKVLIQ
jgi:hypothetical protein